MSCDEPLTRLPKFQTLSKYVHVSIITALIADWISTLALAQSVDCRQMNSLCCAAGPTSSRFQERISDTVSHSVWKTVKSNTHLPNIRPASANRTDAVPRFTHHYWTTGARGGRWDFETQLISSSRQDAAGAQAMNLITS